MKPEFNQYLESIGITDVLQRRIDALMEGVVLAFGRPIENIFVTEYLDAEGARRYENLWCLSATDLMEAKNFVTEDDFDILPLYRNVFYVRIRKEQYDFKAATDKSRLHVHFRGGDIAFGGELKASQRNCDVLRDTVLRQLIANLRRA